MHHTGYPGYKLVWSWCLLFISAASFCLGGTEPPEAGPIELGGLLAEAAKPAHASSVVEGQVRFQVLARRW